MWLTIKHLTFLSLSLYMYILYPFLSFSFTQTIQWSSTINHLHELKTDNKSSLISQLLVVPLLTTKIWVFFFKGMEWIICVCVVMGMLFIMNRWILCGKNDEKTVAKGKVPKGNSGWPLLGETLDFIASGYTSTPVSFLEKRKSL